ncbi:Helo-like-N domain-containing protein [Fusarium keratoplasticum]|uniref:Helo-like-N domain-containing protein n=1 Tax=Fusarium keratoplasticum TaxID=1328300 RepID=A0ACC0QQ31_9HYPO|nr:Helo-like-N domain-containing protein [Fusarium keratoplasticum]KAI8660549.1 Helo-like-N domain-containing protein [Fusarium keratoplasticum]
MEPVSLAFGVVSLGMQLVQTAAAIRERIDAYKSAAKELSILSDKLDDIEAICYSLEAAFGCYEQAPKPWDAMLLKKLHRIMSDCRDKVSRLYDIINKITSSQSNRHIPLNTTGARFLQHRSTIRKCNDELDQSLTSLHLHMTTNILVMNLRPLPQTCNSFSLNVATTTQVETNMKNSVDSAVIKYRKSRARQNVQTQTWNLSYSSLCRLERTKVRKVKQSKSSPATVQEETSFLIGSPLLGLYVKLSLQRGSLSPLSVSLRFPHIFTFASDSWFLTDIARAFRMDSVGKLRHIFDQYSITPSTSLAFVDSTSNKTDTLLGLAISNKATRIHDFLIDRCPSLCHERRHLPIGYGMLYGPSTANSSLDDTCARASAYIDMRGDALEPSEFYALLQGWSSPTHMGFLVDTCKQLFPGEWEPFNRYLWNHIFRSFEKVCDHSILTTQEVDRDVMVGLAGLTRQVISDGLDIHCNMTFHELSVHGLKSALQSLVDYGGRKTLFYCHQWVEMLHQAGVDVDIYLEREIQAISAAWDSHFEDEAYIRELKVEEYMGRNLPTWVMSFAATDAPELFSEFPHLVSWNSFGYIIPGKKTPGDIYHMPDEPKPHQGWKQVLQVSGGVVRPPLERWSLNWHRPPRPLDEEGRKMVEGLAYACDLMESRFERKRLKKLRKAGYMREFAPLRFKERIPGTWVE